jgi:hypothetical protein
MDHCAAARSHLCGSARYLIGLQIARIDLDTAGLILSSNWSAGEPQRLRGPKVGRPLEPDAGNAVEGSEGPMRAGSEGGLPVISAVRLPRS